MNSVPLVSLPIPSGRVSFLHASVDGDLHLASELPESVAVLLGLEPLLSRGLPRLVAVRSAGVNVVLNALPMPRLAMLAVGDHLRLPSSHRLHVSLYNRPVVGPPGEDHLGRECPFCRIPHSADRLVYTCLCNTALHCELEGPADERLECARLVNECPTCRAPIVLTEGYAYVPDGCHIIE